MTCDFDQVEEMAKGLIERFGKDALRESEQRISELKAIGQLEAVALWQEIQKAIKRLL